MTSMNDGRGGNGSTALVKAPPSYIDAAKAHFGEERFALLRDTIGRDLTAPELAMFLEVAMGKKLDPFARQIHAVKRKQRRKLPSGAWVDDWVMTIQTGIDGFRVIAQRTGRYAGQRGPLWCGDDGAWTDVWLRKVPPRAAKVEVLRKDFTEPLVGVALWDEYAQTFEKDGERRLMGLWATHPSVMIAKCAEAVALRRAFPEDLAGLYASEEMKAEDLAAEVRARFAELEERTGKVAPAPPPQTVEAELVPATEGMAAEVANLERAEAAESKPHPSSDRRSPQTSGERISASEDTTRGSPERATVLERGEPEPPTAQEEVGQTRESAPPTDKPTAPPRSGRSATARLLEFKRALDQCREPRNVDATLESWAGALAKLPARGAEMARGYARFIRTRLETGQEIEDAGAAQLCDLAKE